MTTRIRMNLEFAGVVLPVEKNDQGLEVVPLKPIAEVFGLKWEDQRVRISRPDMARRLGTCTPVIRGADQAREMVCIRVDRVVAWMNTINPERVRAAGNEDGADFLEAKQAEWDDVLHEYEARNGILAKAEACAASARERTIRQFIALVKQQQNLPAGATRDVVAKLAARLAADLGMPYQPDLSLAPAAEAQAG